ncbi:MAG: thioredoxin fold domain-containing protein [Ferruginibacter sp.]
MKRSFIAFIILLSFHQVNAQVKTDSIPAYERIPTIPPFNVMIAPDSISFTQEDLKKKQPLIIIVFSPDCEHCKHFTKELLEKYKLLKKARILMASSLNYDLIHKFYDDYKIADYPAIKMGRDMNYFLGTFFSIRMFPTVIVYDKKGNFVKRIDSGITVEKIAELL